MCVRMKSTIGTAAYALDGLLYVLLRGFGDHTVGPNGQ
jgi:hypothetical protein